MNNAVSKRLERIIRGGLRAGKIIVEPRRPEMAVAWRRVLQAGEAEVRRDHLILPDGTKLRFPEGVRRCIICGIPHLSQHAGVRMCPTCRAKATARASALPDTTFHSPAP